MRRFPIHVFVRIIPRQKENRHRSWPVCSPQGDIRRAKDFSAARLTDILRRSYLVSEQSPTSSHSAPLNRRLIMILQTLSVVNRKFQILRRNFQGISVSFPPFPRGDTFPTKTPGGAPSPARNFCETFSESCRSTSHGRGCRHYFLKEVFKKPSPRGKVPQSADWGG